MKSTSKKSTSKQGIALITVLVISALTTILVLSFMSLASSERDTSRTAANGLKAQQIGDQAMALAISQIRSATTVDSTQLWTSQPGAIRVFEGGSGETIYKLYTDDQMVVSSGAKNEAGKDFKDLSTWADDLERYVDLNEPIIRGERVYYPIVDPISAEQPTWLSDDDKRGSGIEGFSYTDEVEEGGFGAEAARRAGLSGEHLPLPVKWVYQTEDGSLGTLNAGLSFVPFRGGNSASSTNRIVARFAFWADDESAKLNINTHAGGFAWDTPRAGGMVDRALAVSQPVQKEWQRYPGHPATTSLAPVLAPGMVDFAGRSQDAKLIYDMVPRIVAGGSKSGSIVANVEEYPTGLKADRDALSPTVDDLVMDANRKFRSFPDGSAPGQTLKKKELSEALERSRFFLTAKSRSPELNPFNAPKIAMWPIYNAERSSNEKDKYQTHLTVYDRLIHYCSTIGRGSGSEFDYIFRREKSDSPTYDLQDIPRNLKLVKYLESLLGKSVPGYGASFLNKYDDDSAEIEQMVTMIFDYIRCTNLFDTSLYEDYQDLFVLDNTEDRRTYTNLYMKPSPAWKSNRFDSVERNQLTGFRTLYRKHPHKGHGQVTPIKYGDSKGFGRFNTISSAAIHVIFAGGEHEYDDGSITKKATYPPVPSDVMDQFEVGIDGFLEGKLKSGANTSKVPSWFTMLTQAERKRRLNPNNWNWNMMFLSDSLALTSNYDKLAQWRDEKFGDLRDDGLYKMDFMSPSNPIKLEPGERMLQAAFYFRLFSPSMGYAAVASDMEIEFVRENGMVFTDKNGTEIPFLGFTELSGNGVLHGADMYVWATNSDPGASIFGGTTNLRGITHETGKADFQTKAFALYGVGDEGRRSALDKTYDEIEDLLDDKDGNSKSRTILGNADQIAQSYRSDLVTVPFAIASDQFTFPPSKVVAYIYDGGPHCDDSLTDENSRDHVQTVDLEFPEFTVNAPKLSDSIMKGNRERMMKVMSLTRDAAGAKWKSLQGEPEALKGRGSFEMTVNDAERGRHLFKEFDVVRMIGVPHGDARLFALKPEISSAIGISPKRKMRPHIDYEQESVYHAHNFTAYEFVGQKPAGGRRLTGHSQQDLVPKLKSEGGDPIYGDSVPLGAITNLLSAANEYGDFDSGFGAAVDGPYINLPDEGNVFGNVKRKGEDRSVWDNLVKKGEIPYFYRLHEIEVAGGALFSPNRIMPGPGMLGSLPSGTSDWEAWRTLLFRPNVDGKIYESHPGAESPPDHLIMDLFWMPVVEPYAISEPLSTAGKVNLNFEIIPFLHVTRSTALRGVFRSEYMLCVPNKLNAHYKSSNGLGYDLKYNQIKAGQGILKETSLRVVIDEDKTIDQMIKRFDSGSAVFKTASEICEIHLIPKEVTNRPARDSVGFGFHGITFTTPEVTDMENGTFWSEHALVGDNARERPYTNIHQRVTTKSNTFNVYYRAQVLLQSRRESPGAYNTWDPALDVVQSEYRGSAIVERFVDPNDPQLNFDFAEEADRSLDVNVLKLSKLYQYRVINASRFAP